MHGGLRSTNLRARENAPLFQQCSDDGGVFDAWKAQVCVVRPRIASESKVSAA